MKQTSSTQSLGALELNDSGLILRWAGGGPEPSPACAMIEDGALLIGRAAASRSRLLPRNVHDRFWAELDTEPLPAPFPADMSAADLAHSHLVNVLGSGGRQLHALLLAVPGSYSSSQLRILLGIARSLPPRICGLVDSALAAVHGAGTTTRSLHVDVELHRSVVTELGVGEQLSRGRVSVVSGVGLAPLRSSLARRVASIFVEKTRFAPFGSAIVEQQLYALIPDLARELGASSGVEVELDTSRGPFAVEVQAEDFVRDSADAVKALLAPVRSLLEEKTRVFVSDRATLVPGLVAALAKLSGEEPALLPNDAGAVGALRTAAHCQAETQALPLILSLPLPDRPGGDARREA